MAWYFKCPKCGEYIADEGEYLVDFENWEHQCPKCGQILTDDDSVEYDYEHFYLGEK